MNLARTFLVLLIIALCFSGLNAQSNRSKYSVSILGGVFLPLGNASDIYKTGSNVGFGVNYEHNNNIDFYFEGNYNIFKYIYDANYAGNPAIIDLKAGTRYFFGESKLRTLIEGGFGAYIISLSSYSNGIVTTEPQTVTKAGIYAGIGESFKISKKFSLFLKTDYNIIFTKSYSTLFLGIHAGAKFGF